jgi:two-component system chemotaxis response regulator CheB
VARGFYVAVAVGTEKGLVVPVLRNAEAMSFAQNEATSVVFSMPKAAIDAGAACEVLAIDRMSSVIAARMNA